MRNARSLFSIASLALAACSDGTLPTAPRSTAPGRPQASISDATRGGKGGFYFLAPLVEQPSFSGTFDPTQQVSVVICALGGSATVAPAASCTEGASLAVAVSGQAYAASWATERNGRFPAGTYYRIRVLSAAGVEWGHADVFLAHNANEYRNIDRKAFVPVVDGGEIPIKFRIEQGAVPGGTTGGTTGGGALDCVANPTHVDCQLT
jgi:hypothetical protein